MINNKRFTINPLVACTNSTATPPFASVCAKTTTRPKLTTPVDNKYQAVYVLRTLCKNFRANGHNIPLTQIALMEKQLLSEFSIQSFTYDKALEMFDSLKDILSFADITDIDMLRVLEVSIVFIAQMYRSNSFIDISLAIVALCHGMFKGPIVGNMIKELTTLISDFIEDPDDNFNEFRATPMDKSAEDIYQEHQANRMAKYEKYMLSKHSGDCTFQSEDVFDVESFFSGLRDKFNFADSIKNLPLMVKLQKFLLSAMSRSVFDNLGLTFDNVGYSAFESQAIIKTSSSTFTFWHSLFDLLTLFFSQFSKAIKTGCMSPFTHSGNSYEDWMNLVYKLKLQEKFLSNPEPQGFNIFKFRSDLEEAIYIGKTIVRTAITTTKFEKDKLRSLLSDLEMIKANDISKKSTQRERAAPFGLLLYGGSSVGKSHLCSIIHAYYTQLFDMPKGSEYKYTRQFTANFWDGYTSSQWFVLLDDVAASNPSLGVMDLSLSEIINVINNVTHVTNQAALEDKGKTPMMAEIVVATTNTLHLNAFAYFSCPLAIQRRLPWVVEVRPKKRFAQPNGIMLDPSKCLNDPDHFDDYWELILLKVEPSGETILQQKAKYVRVDHFLNIETFLMWFGKTVTKHKAQQLALAESEIAMRVLEVCKLCFAPKYACICSAESHEAFVNHFQTQASEEKEEEVYIDDSTIFSDIRCTSVENKRSFLMSYISDSCIPVFNNFKKRMWPDIGSFLVTCAGSFVTLGIFLPALPAFFPFNILLVAATPYLAYACTSVAALSAQNFMFKFAIRHIGDATSLKFASLIKYGKMFGLCAGAYAMYRCMKYICPSTKVDLFPQSVEEGGTPIPHPDERPNVWYAEVFNVSTFDVSTTTKSWKALSSDVVKDIVYKNVVRFRMSSDNVHFKNTGAFCVGGNLYAVNLHAVPNTDRFSLKIMSSNSIGISSNIVVHVDSTQILKFVNCDLAFIVINNVPPKKNLCSLFPGPDFGGKYLGSYLAINVDGNKSINDLIQIEKSNHDHPLISKDSWSAISNVLTVDGDCGAVMLAFCPMGPVILGLHALGNKDNVVISTQITQQMILDCYSHFKDLSFDSGVPRLDAVGISTKQIGELSVKSPIRYIENGTAEVYGSFVGHRAKPKSRVARTMLANLAERQGWYTQKFGPPMMSTYVPWRNALLETVKVPTSFSQNIIDHCTHQLCLDIESALPRNQIMELEKYDLKTAINGATGVSYVDKLNRGTSAGFPWNKCKRSLLHPIESEPGENFVDVDDDMKDRIANILSIYRQGKRYFPIYVQHLKDEPRKFSKIASGNTRIMGGAPMDWSIVVRMFYLPIIRLMQNNRFAFETALGTVAQSREWENLYAYLCDTDLDIIKNDPLAGLAQFIVAGDFRFYDKTMPPPMILAAFAVMQFFMKIAGWPPEDLIVARGIALDVAYPLIDMNGDIMMLFGTNPSGVPVTTPVNSMVHSIYMRYTYVVLNPEHNCVDFKKNVKLLTYGDDGVMGVSPTIPWFNHTTIQKVLADNGITYTMADKTSESKPYIHISEVSFLKRKWVYDDEVTAFLAPLDLESIEKSIMTCVYSKSVSHEYQMISSVGGAVREYFYHGRAVYDLWVPRLKFLCTETGLDPLIQAAGYDITFPTFDNLMQKFHDYEIKTSSLWVATN